jgi:hypothetical protein
MEIKENIEQLMVNIEIISDMFYKQMNAEAFDKFNLILNEIELVMNELNMLQSQNISLDFDDKKINATLIEAMNAMENKDNILLADILKYNLIENFKDIANNL